MEPTPDWNAFFRSKSDRELEMYERNQPQGEEAQAALRAEQRRRNEVRAQAKQGEGDGVTILPEPQAVRIVDFNMPFGSMVGFMVKWVVATIPAIIILLVIVFLFYTMLAGLSGPYR